MFKYMSEATARFTFNGSCGLSVFAAAASVMLGTRDLQWQAALFLVFSVSFCVMSILSYMRYKKLRDARWKLELKKSEDELNQVFNHARMNIIIDHITGPLHNEQVIGDVAEPSGEHSIARL